MSTVNQSEAASDREQVLAIEMRVDHGVLDLTRVRGRQERPLFVFSLPPRALSHVTGEAPELLSFFHAFR